ncbi:MAG: hypothetical protein GQ574_21095 [Crocinitomix sp.]|nr:hypothetical protein [Crocinitomix sp.]
MKDHLRMRWLEGDQKRREKLDEEKKTSSKKIRIFLKIFVLLLGILAVNSLYKAFILSESIEVEAKVISIHNQAFTIPMDGSVNTFIIEYEYKTPKGNVIDINEISSSEIYNYFQKKPLVGDFISIKYAKNDPEVSEIVKGNW